MHKTTILRTLEKLKKFQKFFRFSIFPVLWQSTTFDSKCSKKLNILFSVISKRDIRVPEQKLPFKTFLLQFATVLDSPDRFFWSQKFMNQFLLLKYNFRIDFCLKFHRIFRDFRNPSQTWRILWKLKQPNKLV